MPNLASAVNINNTAPSITTRPVNMNVGKNVTVSSVVIVNDIKSVSSVIVSAVSSDQSIVTNNNIVVTSGTKGNRTITVKPTANATGTVTISYSASARQLKTYGSYTLTFTNTAPVISATITPQTFVKNVPIVPFSLPVANDVNIGESLTYSLSGLPIGFSFNSNTRQISGTPTFVSSSTVIYKVTDKSGATATKSFIISVIDNDIKSVSNDVNSSSNKSIYISQKTGVDTNDGSQSKPFKTIEMALSKIQSRNSLKTDYTIYFIDSTYQLSESIKIDSVLLADGSSLTLQGATGNTKLTFATTFSSDSLEKNNTLLPKLTTETSYNFGGIYGYVDTKPVLNPATGSSSCPSGQTATTFLGQHNVDWPATFCYGVNNGSNVTIDFGGMYGYVEGKPTNNVITGSASCPEGYKSVNFWGTHSTDLPATFCYHQHVAGDQSEYEFGGIYGYVNGVAVTNPITGTLACPVGYTSSQFTGTYTVDWPSWYCYRKIEPVIPINGQVYIIPVNNEPAGLIVDGKIADRASYEGPSVPLSLNGTFEIQIPKGISFGTSPLVAVGKNNWRMFRCPITELNVSSVSNGTYTGKVNSSCLNDAVTPSGYDFSSISSVEGSAAFFSSHGQWVYIPGQSPKVAVYLTKPSSINVVPANKPQILSIIGSTKNPIKNVYIKNITFSDGGFQDTSKYATFQSGVIVRDGAKAVQRAAIEIENVNNVSIEKSVFTNLMGAGVWVGYNSQNVKIINNEFIDIAGTGVGAGSWNPPISEDRSISTLKINSNSFKNTGRIFWDSGAIFATYIKNSEISGNIIDHVPYSGIAIGWGWTYDPQTGLSNNVIHSNRISNVTEILNDGAGIYLNSRMNGTSVYNNIIGPVGQTKTPWINYPIYTDDGSGGVTIYDNKFQSIDFGQFSNISIQSPIFGPMYRVLTPSPCGYKACDVNQFRNTVPIVESAQTRINMLYQMFLGRNADTSEMAYFQNKIVSGVSVTDVAWELVNSSSSIMKNGSIASMTSSSYVNFLYTKILGRAPDTGGNAYWVDTIDKGMTYKAAFISFMTCDELKNNKPSLFAYNSTNNSAKVLGDYTMCVDIPRNIHRGSESAYVSNLQKFLQSKGFLNETPSGFYGDKTVEAVKDYQASKGLPVTGMVYDFTRQAIKSDTCQ